MFRKGQQNGKVSRERMENFFRGSNLPVPTMEKIWSLSDQDKDGFLDKYEWTVANHLIVKARIFGYPIPYQVIHK